MGREYVVRTWVKHDANDPNVIPESALDERAGYSGEQIGNRLARSNGHLKIRSSTPGWFTDGTADLGAFADQNEISKANPLFLIDPAYKVLAEYQDKLLALDTALHNGSLPPSLYKQAVAVLDAKHAKAEKKLQKIIDSEIEQPEESAIPKVVAFSSVRTPSNITEEDKKEAMKNYFKNGLTV